MITRPNSRRFSTPSLSSIQTYLNYLTTGIVIINTIGFIVLGGIFWNIYGFRLPDKQDVLPELYNGTVVFPAILGFTLNKIGLVVGVDEGIPAGPNGTMLDPVIVYGPSNFPNAAEATAVGDSFFINVTGDTALFGLVDRGLEGTYVNPIVTYTNEGVAATVANGSVPTASDIIYQNETVADAIDDIQTALDTSQLLSYGPTDFPLSKQLVAQGPSFFIDATGPNVVAGLLPRGVAGTFVRPTVTYAGDGTATAVADGPPLQAFEIEFGSSDVEAALLSNILVSQFSPSLNNSQVFTPNFDAFIFSSGNGTFGLTLRPRPMIGMTCTHPTQITYDMQFGLPESCTSGPAPGTPTGAATLDGSGKIIASQLPDFLFALRLVGLWNAATNVPFLTNASCPGDATFYYLVSDSGNTSLGHHDIWFEGDKALCLNGTWNRISRPQMTFNGRSNDVVPELGDYDASLIGFGNTTLDALLGYGFVMWTSSPALPGGQFLQGIAGQTVVSGTIVGLAPKPNFPAALTVFNGFINYLEIDHFGRVETVMTGSAITNIFGTAFQIFATSGPNVTLSLAQNIDTNANVQFNSAQLSTLVLNGRTMLAPGTGNITFPSGAGTVIMTTGVQTMLDPKSFAATPTILGGEGLRLNNPSNTFSTTMRANSGLTANTDFNPPPTSGVLGQILTATGGGNTAWQALPALFVDAKYVTLTNDTTVTSLTFVQLNGMTLGTSNNATERYKFNFVGYTVTTNDDCVVEMQLFINGVPVSNEFTRIHTRHLKDTKTHLLNGIVNSVAPGSTFSIQVRSLTATTIIISKRSFMIEKI